MIIIPLDTVPEQKLNIRIDGIRYDLRVLLNLRLIKWTMDIEVDGVQLVGGVSLVGGIDIMQQYPQIALKRMYAVNVDMPRYDPTIEGFAAQSQLAILTEEEVSLEDDSTI